MLTENEIVKILGALLILIYAFERFNAPPSNRAMTTAARYYKAASAYLLIYLVAYFLLCNYQDLLNLLLRVLNRNEFDKSWPAEVVGAILLSSIVSFKINSEFVNYLSSFFYLHNLSDLMKKIGSGRSN